MAKSQNLEGSLAELSKVESQRLRVWFNHSSTTIFTEDYLERNE